jgi:hypothetical protein
MLIIPQYGGAPLGDLTMVPDLRSFDGPHWAAPRYPDIQNRIGSMLREQYELPKDLPHRLLTLMIEVNNTEDDS